MKINRTVTIATRGSMLALTQTRFVQNALMQQNPDLKIELAIIKTRGDAILDTALSKIGDKGLFVKEIETALLEGSADLAVHSIKDLPTESPEGLIIAAVPQREDPHDVFISKNAAKLEDQPHGAVIATSSLRRKAQLLAYRPDLKIIDMRGNVETRLQKLQQGSLHGLVLARAGLQRLGLEQQSNQIIPFEVMLPAPGQGALGVQVRTQDSEILGLVAGLNDRQSFQAVSAERSFLQTLEGGCQIPIGAHCHSNGNELIMAGKILSLDGSQVVSDTITVDIQAAAAAGQELAKRLIKRGATKLLEAIRGKIA